MPTPQVTSDHLQDDAEAVFLALTIWREARGEPIAAKVAVGGCFLNRVQRPSWWGHNLLEVLFTPWQVSSLTNPKDKQLTYWPLSGDASWVDCLRFWCK